MTNMIGIIPAAGSGVRARPYSYEVHKGLFAIDGKSNIARIIETMRDDLGISEIVIIVGYMADAIRDTFGSGQEMDVSISYVENQHLDRGWAWSVLLAKPALAGRNACVMLADEFYQGANFKDLLEISNLDRLATVLVKRNSDSELIKRNFSVEMDGTRIIRLVENPTVVMNDILGMATFIVAPALFTLLETAYGDSRPSIEFVNFLDELIREGHSVHSFEMQGQYINLNDVSSLEAANDLAIRARLEKGTSPN